MVVFELASGTSLDDGKAAVERVAANFGAPDVVGAQSGRRNPKNYGCRRTGAGVIVMTCRSEAVRLLAAAG